MYRKRPLQFLAAVVGLGLLAPLPTSAQSFDQLTERAMYTSGYRTPSALYNDAEMERAAGHHLRAQKLYDQAAQLYGFEGDLRGQALSLERCADMLIALERNMTARQRLEHAYTLRAQLEDREGQIRMLEQLGGLYIEANDATRATLAYEALRKLYRQQDNAGGEARSYLGTGQAAWRAGREKAARRDLRKALEMFQKLEMGPETAEVYKTQAAMARESGRYEMAYGLDLTAMTYLPEDQDISLNLIEDAIGAGRMPEALTRIDWLNTRQLDPIEQVQVRISELIAHTALKQPAQMRRSAAALSMAFSEVAPTEQKAPRLEAARQYLRRAKGLDDASRETLMGIVQVLSVAKTPLSQGVLDGQLEVLTGRGEPLATTRP